MRVKTESSGSFKLRIGSLNRTKTAKNEYRGNLLKMSFFALIFDFLIRFSKLKLRLVIWQLGFNILSKFSKSGKN